MFGILREKLLTNDLSIYRIIGSSSGYNHSIVTGKCLNMWLLHIALC